MRWRYIAASILLIWATGEPGTAAAGNRAEALASLGMVAPDRLARPLDFALPRLGGGEVRLEARRGKVVLLRFWTTRCAQCVLETPALQAVQQALGEQGLVVLAVNVGESRAEVQAFADDLQINFTVALDQEARTARSYGVRGLPTAILIDRRGEAVGRALGARDWTSDAALHLFLELLDEPSDPLTQPDRSH